MPKLTKRVVEAVTPDHKKSVKIWDSEIKGFGVIILPSGRRTYCVDYRNADRIKKRCNYSARKYFQKTRRFSW